MTVRVSRNSRLRFGDLLTVDGIEFWDMLVLDNIPELADDVRYQVIQGDRMDILAYRFYEDAALWWVIAVGNGMELIPTDLNEGEIIRIPSPRFVQQELFLDAKGK